MTTVKSCTCKNEYQDETYGHGRRVMNQCNKGFRCTVCGKEHVSSVKK